MNNLIAKLKVLFDKYKYFLIPIIPLLFFIGLLFFIPSGEKPKEEAVPNVNPTGVPNKSTTTNTTKPTPYPTSRVAEAVEEVTLDQRPGLIAKENLADGTIRYTFKSSNTNRPNTYIARDEHTVLFERNLILPQYPVKITDYTESFGPPQRTITGSTFYGPNAQTLIYAHEGIAIIGNPQTNLVYEQHLFEPTTLNEYIRLYGDDILIDKRD